MRFGRTGVVDPTSIHLNEFREEHAPAADTPMRRGSYEVGPDVRRIRHNVRRWMPRCGGLGTRIPFPAWSTFRFDSCNACLGLDRKGREQSLASVDRVVVQPRALLALGTGV